MKILVFPFRNEVEIVETKIATLAEYVDCIIIAEGAYTFSGNKRDLVFGNWARTSSVYADYQDKIIYTIDSEMIDAPPHDRFDNEHTAARWGRDIHLRNSLGDVALSFPPASTVILTDADEIPDPRWVQSLENIKHCEHVLMWRHCYYVDYRAPQCRLHEQVCRAFPVSRLQDSTMEEMARCEPDLITGHPDKGYGWHFTYMGGPSAIKQKLADFAHGEYDKPPWNTLDHIEQHMFTGKDLFNRSYLDCQRVMLKQLPYYLQAKRLQNEWGHLWSRELPSSKQMTKEIG